MRLDIWNEVNEKLISIASRTGEIVKDQIIYNNNK